MEHKTEPESVEEGDAPVKNTLSTGSTGNANGDSLCQFSVKEFNKNRHVIIRNIPPVTYEEVKEFLNGYEVSNISISRKCRHAIVALVNGEDADLIVERLDGQELLGETVEVCLHPSETLICVVHLPFNLDDADFRSMLEEFGSTEKCFLMRGKDGRSKGYGFVEYAHNKEKCTEVQELMDGMRQGSCILHVNFLDSSVLTYEQLHSCCLMVSNLSSQYTDQEQFLKIFSEHTAPVFCKLSPENEPGQNGAFGVVGFETWQQAEETQKLTNGRVLEQSKIRVTYCIPGQSSESVYDKLMKQAQPTKPGLLPMPSTPKFQRLQDKTNLASPMVKTLLSKSPRVMSYFQQVLSQLQEQIIQQQALMGTPLHALFDPNLQIALLAVLLSAQLQQAQPTLMSNPVLQDMLLRNMQQQQNPQPWASGGAVPQPRPSLLGNPLIAQANSMIQVLAPGLVSTGQQQQQQQPQQQQQQEQEQQEKKPFPSLFSHLPNQTFNPLLLSNFSQLLDVAQGSNSSSNSATDTDTQAENSAGLKPGLLGDAPEVASLGPPGTVSSDTAAASGKSTGLLGEAPGLEGEKVGLLGSKPGDQPTSLLSGNDNKSAGGLLGQAPGDSIKPTGLLGDAPSAGTGLLGNAPGDVTVESSATTAAPEPAAPKPEAKPSSSGHPFFDLPNVGLANPLLASYLEGQMRDKLGKGPGGLGNQWPSATAAPPSVPRNAPLIAEPPRQFLMQPQHTEVSKKPGLLGDFPMPHQLWNQGTVNLPEKKTLTFDEDTSLLGSAPGVGQSQKKSLLGDPPVSTQMSAQSGDQKQSSQYSYGSGYDQQQWYQHMYGMYNQDPNASTASQGSESGYSTNTNNESTYSQSSDTAYGYYGNNASSTNEKGGDSSKTSANQSTETGYGGDASANQYGDYNSWSSYYWQQQQCQNSYAYQQMYQQYMNQYGAYYGQQQNPGTSSTNDRKRKKDSEFEAKIQALMPPPVAPPLPVGANRPSADTKTESKNNNSQFAPTAMSTPVGQKRPGQPHLLPSPEPSPEGLYVGQHSQGLGGHYADSYPKKRKTT